MGEFDMKTIGLVAAMQQEVRPLLRRVGKRESVRVGRFHAVRFSVAGVGCLLIQSGIGQQNATEAARALMTSGRPNMLISFGIAGGIHSDLRIGDVVAGESAALLEGSVPGKVLPLMALSTRHKEGIAEAFRRRGARLVAGPILTPSGPQPAPDRTMGLANPVVEMETFAIAEVAASLGVPLLALRSISDSPEAPIPFPVEKMYNAEYRLRIGWMLREILRRPGLIAKLARLTRNSDLAAENAACAVLAFLNRSSMD
jgi:adenosylhomocysteine nucleosidase